MNLTLYLCRVPIALLLCSTLSCVVPSVERAVIPVAPSARIRNPPTPAPVRDIDFSVWLTRGLASPRRHGALASIP